MFYYSAVFYFRLGEAYLRHLYIMMTNWNAFAFNYCYIIINVHPYLLLLSTDITFFIYVYKNAPKSLAYYCHDFFFVFVHCIKHNALSIKHDKRYY